MAMVDTSSKKQALTTKANGGTTECKEKAKPSSDKDRSNIQVNGRLTNTMDGVSFSQIQNLVQNGCPMKVNSRTEWSKEGARWSSRMVTFMMGTSEATKFMVKVK